MDLHSIVVQGIDLARKLPKSAPKWLAIVALPAAAFYTVALVVAARQGIPALEIIRDTAVFTEQSTHLGFISNIGVFAWIAAAAIALFGARHVPALSSIPHARLLLMSGGIFSLLLAGDDFFMFHDRAFENYQKIFYIAYALLAGLLFLLIARAASSLDVSSFLFAGGCLGLSVVVDVMQRRVTLDYGHTSIVEEGFKFVGIIGWVYFWSQTAGAVVGETPAPVTPVT